MKHATILLHGDSDLLVMSDLFCGWSGCMTCGAVYAVVLRHQFGRSCSGAAAASAMSINKCQAASPAADWRAWYVHVTSAADVAGSSV